MLFWNKFAKWCKKISNPMQFSSDSKKGAGSGPGRGSVTSNSIPRGESKSPWVYTNPFEDVLVSEDHIPKGVSPSKAK